MKILVVLLVSSLWAAPLLKDFLNKDSKRENLLKIKKKVFKNPKKSIPILVEVMKDKKYSDRHRWLATMLLARVMGKKSSDFLSKFLTHPSWVLRMATLKSLLHLKERKFGEKYATLLSDPSLLVRTQALENIRALNLDKFAVSVWKMLEDEQNYQGKKGQRKRLDLLKTAVKTVGDLNFKVVKKSLLIMMRKKRYKNLLAEIDYSLVKITGVKSPSGSLEVKKHFWKTFDLKNRQL